MSSKSYFNRFLPLAGNIGTQQMATIGLSTTATSIDLRTIFGLLDNGEQLMIKADAYAQPSGWRGYFSFSDKATPIDENLTGPGTASGGQCWPLLDGQEMLAHLTSGRAVATGFATQISYNVINVKSTVGSGAFKLMRHTLAEPQDASRFQAPVRNWPSAAASGLTYPSGGWNPRP